MHSYDISCYEAKKVLRRSDEGFLEKATAAANQHHWNDPRQKRDWITAQEVVEISLGHGYPVECCVEFKAIAEYMEEIPDRVMESYLAACELGFADFLVAQPVVRPGNRYGLVGVVIEEQEHWQLPKPPDPVLIGVLNGVMFELDMWE